MGHIPRKLIWNPPLNLISLLGRCGGKDFDAGSAEKKGIQRANGCPLYEEEEENIDHLLCGVSKLESCGLSYLLCLASFGCFLGQSKKL